MPFFRGVVICSCWLISNSLERNRQIGNSASSSPNEGEIEVPKVQWKDPAAFLRYTQELQQQGQTPRKLPNPKSGKFQKSSSSPINFRGKASNFRGSF